MDNDFFLLIPILFPIIAGVLLLFLPIEKNKTLLRGYVGTILVCNLIIIWWILRKDNANLILWSLVKGISLSFHLDLLSKLFAGLLAFVWVLVGIYSFHYMTHEKNEKRYFTFYLITFGIICGIDFASNLVTMYVFYELMTISAMLLVIHSMTKEAIYAALKYLFYSFAGASLGLFCIFFVSQYTTSLTFVPGGVLDFVKLSGRENTLLLVIFFAIIGFGIKAGLFPFHGWLPTAHPVAPAPASAVLSGIITKAGVFAIIRVVFYIVGADFIRGTWVQYSWTILALLTIFMGSVLAYKEQGLKKRLAYSTVSQVSYILFGLSLLNISGAIGALMHIVFHSIIKNTLFLAAGTIIFQTGCTKVKELEGIGKKMPITLWCFTLVSLALIGIPPTSGFVSKWYLAMGALESPLGILSYLGPVVLLISAILTAGYLLSISHKAFFYDSSINKTVSKENYTMIIPMLIFTIFAVGIGIFSGSFLSFVTNIAKEIL